MSTENDHHEPAAEHHDETHPDSPHKVVTCSKRALIPLTMEQVEDRIQYDPDVDDFLSSMMTTIVRDTRPRDEYGDIIDEDPAVVKARNESCCAGLKKADLFFALPPAFKFYIIIAAFALPTIISICQVVFNQSKFAKRLYIDGCYNSTLTELIDEGLAPSSLLTTATNYSIIDCIECNDGKSFVSSKSLEIPQYVTVLRWVAVALSLVAGLTAAARYSRLAFQEFLAMKLLSVRVLIRSDDTSIWQQADVWWTLFWAVIAGGFTGFVLLVQQASIPAIVLANATISLTSASSVASCSGLAASFDLKENDGTGLSPLGGIEILQIVVTAIIPFLLVVKTIYGAATSTFTTIGMEELVNNAQYSERLFRDLKNGAAVNERVLMKAISKYSRKLYRANQKFLEAYPASKDDPERKIELGGFASFLRRLLVFDFRRAPPPTFFLWTWGSRYLVKDINFDVPKAMGITDKLEIKKMILRIRLLVRRRDQKPD